LILILLNLSHEKVSKTIQKEAQQKKIVIIDDSEPSDSSDLDESKSESASVNSDTNRQEKSAKVQKPKQEKENNAFINDEELKKANKEKVPSSTVNTIMNNESYKYAINNSELSKQPNGEIFLTNL
jgi:hypothetical protein